MTSGKIHPISGHEEYFPYFPAAVYHLHTLSHTERCSRTAAVQRENTSLTTPYQLPEFQHVDTTRRMNMAKGQQRKTKEAKKPKKQPAPAKLTGINRH
ncbi:MAG: hypothetical protein NUV63_12660 [Gallionella sp.]|nr:hypothetical protein [Gallionella sp.]